MAKLFLITVFLFGSIFCYGVDTITGYRVVKQCVRTMQGKQLLAMRSFVKNGESMLLCVDPHVFKSVLIKKRMARLIAFPLGWATTPFMALLSHATAAPYKIANHGLRRVSTLRKGVILSIDLCPSTRKFDKKLFLRVLRLPRRARRAVPIVVAVSGLWIKRHRSAFRWLREQERKGRLHIEWVNHSLTHPYYPGRALRKNFLLAKRALFLKEVLDNEKELLRNGLLPAPFFRFPGLIADRGLLQKLRQLSLIPLGCASWMAKNQRPKPGDIMLVHGNGNEPYGLRMLYRYFWKQRLRLRSGSLRLCSLSSALASSQ